MVKKLCFALLLEGLFRNALLAPGRAAERDFRPCPDRVGEFQIRPLPGNHRKSQSQSFRNLGRLRILWQIRPEFDKVTAALLISRRISLASSSTPDDQSPRSINVAARRISRRAAGRPPSEHSSSLAHSSLTIAQTQTHHRRVTRRDHRILYGKWSSVRTSTDANSSVRLFFDYKT